MSIKHWASWLILGGLALDLVDAFTSPGKGQPGIVYGASSPLASISAQLPYSISIGETLIAVGVIVHLMKHEQA